MPSQPAVERRATAAVREWVEWLSDFAREVKAVREEASRRLR
jgi:hypothetical protein